MESIKVKIFLYLILPFVILGTLYFAFSNFYLKKTFLSQLEISATDTTRRIAEKIKEDMLNEDHFILTRDIFDEKYARTNISSITVFDGNGLVLGSTAITERPQNITLSAGSNKERRSYTTVDDRQLYMINQPIYSGLYPIGMSQIAYDFSESTASFNYALYLFIGFSIAGLLITSLLAIRVANGIVHPILALTDAAAEFSRGHFVERAHVYSNDEIGQLTESFNAMAASLEKSQEAIGVERSSLETKVSELEAWQKATIGRELKMVQLKETLKNCEAQRDAEKQK